MSANKLYYNSYYIVMIINKVYPQVWHVWSSPIKPLPNYTLIFYRFYATYPLYSLYILSLCNFLFLLLLLDILLSNSERETQGNDVAEKGK